MTTPKKAKLTHVKWEEGKTEPTNVPGNFVDVQFNPQTLRVTYTNNNTGGTQPGGSSRQLLGSGSTKLAVELFFDTTATGADVRDTTRKIAFFVGANAKSAGGSNKARTPPGVQFEWGTFIFAGIVNSMDETLDYFSEEGVPLRATISLSISRQTLEMLKNKAAAVPGGGGELLKTAEFGGYLQKDAGPDWKGVAAANNIDDPLRLKAGLLINMNAGVGASVGLSAGASISGGASVGLSVSGGASVSGSALAKASASAGVSARAAASASVNASASGSASLGGGVSGSASLKRGR